MKGFFYFVVFGTLTSSRLQSKFFPWTLFSLPYLSPCFLKSWEQVMKLIIQDSIMNLIAWPSEGWKRIPFLLSRLGSVRFCSRQTFVYITAFKKNFKCYVRFCLVLHSFHASTLQRKHLSHFCGKTLVIFYLQREKVNASEKNMRHILSNR